MKAKTHLRTYVRSKVSYILVCAFYPHIVYDATWLHAYTGVSYVHALWFILMYCMCACVWVNGVLHI